MSKLSLRHLLPIASIVLSACAGAAKNDPCVPSPEVCDGKDNDCNGQIDDGLGVVTCGQGICAVTVPACANGSPGVCTPAAPETEICDGLDNDCDGVIDNGCACVQGTTQACYSGPPGTVGVGPCHAGLQTCGAGEWGPCAGEVKPEAEVCDGVDNDCDGQVDDGLPATTCGIGACTVTIASCESGAPTTCTPGTPSPEVCDGVDDDCNGIVDDDVPGVAAPCSTGKPGICAAGTTACQGGAIVCNQNVQPSAEVCNGVDDNCDGQVDEGNPGGAASCTTGKVGVCSAGTTACQNGAIVCNQNVQPSAEVCDSLDDNCDGQVDEGNPGGGASCPTGKPGICAAGTTACQAGAIVCNQNVQPSGEVCDGKDNNCDGQVDEGNPGGGSSCTTGKPGVCAAGTTVCVGGALVCNQNVQPSAEACNGLDDNCDGQVDEGVKTTFYRDVDGDGYGNFSVSTQACAKPAGYVANATDCNDASSAVHPGATEVCNGMDDNCDGQIDEGVKTTFYRDADGDGYGTSLVTVQACSQPAGYSMNGTDCNDSAAAVHPGAVELCNGVDDNCNGSVDEGNPGGGMSCNTGRLGVCSAGTTVCQSGAISCIQNVQPSPEVCDGKDNDCNGLVDDGCT